MAEVPEAPLQEYKQALKQLSAAAQITMEDVLAKAIAAGLSPEEIKDTLAEAMIGLTDILGKQAISEASDFYTAVRPKSKTPFTATPGNLPTAEQLKAIVSHEVEKKGADTPEAALPALKGSIQRIVTGAARSTIVNTGEADKKRPRFARVPAGGKTCAFCTMLAGRGFVYKTAKTAGGLKQFHYDCHCTIVPGFGKNPTVAGYDPVWFEKIYRDSIVYNPDGTVNLKATLAAMRAKFPDELTDGDVDAAEAQPVKLDLSKLAEEAEEEDEAKEPIDFNLGPNHYRSPARKEAIAWAMENVPPIPEDEWGEPSSAANVYSGSAYDEWNQRLRDSEGNLDSPIMARPYGRQGNYFQRATPELDAQIAQTSTPEDVFLWRGTTGIEFQRADGSRSWDISLEEAKDLLKSDESRHQKNYGYTSSSIGDPPAFDYKPVYIKFKVPKGTPVANLMVVSKMGDDEREMLLPRGLEYEITNVTERKDMYDSKILIEATVVSWHGKE